MDYSRLMEIASDLENYAYLDQTELGEYWSAVAALVNKLDCMSDSFKEAYVKEMLDLEETMRKNYRIVERLETITVTRKELEYIE